MVNSLAKSMTILNEEIKCTEILSEIVKTVIKSDDQLDVQGSHLVFARQASGGSLASLESFKMEITQFKNNAKGLKDEQK